MLTKNRIKEVSRKSAKDLFHSLPMFAGAILVYTMINAIFVDIDYESIFRKNIFWDSLMGGALGSIMSGETLMSYILGKEFLESGVSLVAVTAFIATWSSVAFSQIPFEAAYLTRKFAIWRNLLAFIVALVISMLVVLLL